MSVVKFPSVIAFLALSSAFSPLVACSAGAASEDPGLPIAPPPPPAPERGVVVADFIAHLDPRDHAITFHRAKRAAVSPGFRAQDLDDPGDTLVIDSDGEEGSGSRNTVELVTNSVGLDAECPAGLQTHSFCANVTLRHFHDRSLSHVFVQATYVSDAEGNPLTDHAGLNSAPAEHGLDATWGLWKYTGQGVTAEGVLGENGPFNAGSADWVFANPDDAETWIYLRVVAAVGYTSYAAAPSPASFIDACAVGSSTTASSTTQTMPFPFTFWNTTSPTVAFNRRGMVTFAGATGSASGDNVCLPNESAPAPGLFVFWDDLGFGPGGRMCWATIGDAPNRRFVIQWKDMDFVADDVGSSLTFEAILSEGTNRIDTVYGTMVGPDGSSSGRATGSSATVGLQNSTGTSAPVAECGGTKYGSGSSFRFEPIP